MKFLNRKPLSKVVFEDDLYIWASLAFSLALSFQMFASTPSSKVIDGVKLKMACLGCGLTESYTPKMLLVSMGFIIIPSIIVIFVIYKIKKDEAFRKNSALSNSNFPQKN